MYLDTRQKLIFLFAVAIIYLTGWILQTTILLNADVSWAMHVAKRMLAGGSYTTDFFEINPPMLFFMHIPYIVIAEWFSAPLILSLRIYIFLLVSLSFYCCYICVLRIFATRDSRLGLFFLMTILLIFLIFLPSVFGQKEHLMMIYIMPYLLTLTARLHGYKFPLYFTILIGCLAAVGFSLKPFFLVTFILIEFYYIFASKKLSAVVRVEAIIIAVSLLCYLSIIIIFYQDYLSVVVPHALHLYYNGASRPLFIRMTEAPMPFCYLAIFFSLLSYKNNPYKKLSAILNLALIGFLIGYLLQGTGWGYQLLPVMDMAILLYAFLFYIFAFQTDMKKFDYVVLLSLGLLLSIYLYIDLYASWRSTLLLLICSALFPLAPRSALAHLGTLAVGAVVFTFLFFITGNSYLTTRANKIHFDKLIAFMQQHTIRNQSIYVFSLAPYYTFPIVDYAGVTSASRSILLWQIPGLLKQFDNINDKNLFFNMLIEDLATKKPSLIFVDLLNNSYVVEPICFSYLKYFAQNQRFRDEWKHYRYFTTLESRPAYKLAVYKRVD